MKRRKVSRHRKKEQAVKEENAVVRYRYSTVPPSGAMVSTSKMLEIDLSILHTPPSNKDYYRFWIMMMRLVNLLR